MKCRWIVLSLICLFASLPFLHAQEQVPPTPAQAWQRLKDGNDRFASDKLEVKDLGAKKRQELAKGQKPFAIVLTCADSRVAPELLFNQGLGDIFVIRVAGNITDAFIVASMEYAVEHFHVPLIVILGHESCGAVTAALGKDKPGGNLGKLIDEIHVGKDLPMDRDAALAGAIKNNVLRHVELLTTRSDIIRDHVKEKKTQVVAGVYGLSSGKVEWLNGK